MDTEEVNNFDPEVFEYCHKLYGSYVLEFDKMAVRNFNYAALFDQIKKTVNVDVIEDSDKLTAALDDASTAAAKLVAKNETMAEADDVAAYNKDMNYLFRDVSKKMFTIDWNEEFQFVHLYKQTNVECLEAAIDALEKGDIPTALDENIYSIDLNWYASAFDKDTYDYYVNQVLDKDAENSWGEGYLKSNADLWSVVQSLKDKYNQEDADVTDEISTLKDELEVQKADLRKVVNQEIKDLNNITETIETLSK